MWMMIVAGALMTPPVILGSKTAMAMGSATPIQRYNSVAGGGWHLISSRTNDVDALFADARCLDGAENCSGTIPRSQVGAGVAPDLLFATLDGVFWVRLTGLLPPVNDALRDMILLDRPLGVSSSCEYPHYCDRVLDPLLAVHSSSANVTPRFQNLPSQYARYGGLWFGNGGGSIDDHVLSLNYAPYCQAGGFSISDNSNGQLGNVICGEPGALYFRYETAPSASQGF